MDKTKYLFIDGGCLRETIKEVNEKFFHDENFDIDYQKLSHGFYKTFYYDAYTPKKDETDEEYEEKIKPQIEFFNRLRSIRGFHVYEGITRRRKKKNEQKKVDIMIAVDMLTHTIRGNMDEATLIASDLDYKPLIDALVQEGMFVTLWYQKNHTNEELIYAADAAQPITISQLYASATNNFQDNFKIPRMQSKQGKEVSQFTLLEKWLVNSGFEVELYKNVNSYVMVFPEFVNKGYFTYAEYENLDLLKIYVEDSRYSIDWTRSE